MGVQLIDAVGSRKEQEWILEVLPLYLRELQKYDSSYRKLIKWASQSPESVINWFCQENLTSFTINSNSKRAGFVFVAQKPFPRMSAGVDYRLGEFYILKEFRRQGIGRLAAVMVFNLFRGKWEVTEIPKNKAAISFWRHVIGFYTDNRYKDIFSDGLQRQYFNSDL